MVNVLLALGLSGLLVSAAWQDWRARRVAFPLMWALYAIGVSVGLWRAWPVGLAALAAGVCSTLPLPAALKRTGSVLLIASAGLVNEPAPAAAIALCGVFWWAFEMRWIGGADSTIALALLALFPTWPFVAALLTTWSACGAYGWLRRQQSTLPLLMALVAAALGYAWCSVLKGGDAYMPIG